MFQVEVHGACASKLCHFSHLFDKLTQDVEFKTDKSSQESYQVRLGRDLSYTCRTGASLSDVQEWGLVPVDRLGKPKRVASFP